MKIKTAPKKGKVVVELESRDEGLLKPLSFELQRILVPVDFSDTAKKALQYAVPFANAFDAEVLLVHVVQPYTVPAEFGYMPPELPVSQQEYENSAREELDKLRTREIGVGTRAQVQVRVGVPWQEIVAAAGEAKADLIILSTHGRTGLKHVVLGSVAEHVVRHAPCPVLVVRERERDFIPISTKIETLSKTPEVK
ncbi:MAG: universal stress protein [Verrucomicrobiales bacterium]|nr:universal stress protein [Verrucomicrobiales bacterium]